MRKLRKITLCKMKVILIILSCLFIREIKSSTLKRSINVDLPNNGTTEKEGSDLLEANVTNPGDVYVIYIGNFYVICNVSESFLPLVAKNTMTL